MRYLPNWQGSDGDWRRDFVQYNTLYDADFVETGRRLADRWYKKLKIVTVAKTINKGVRKGYNIVLNNRTDSQY